MVELPVLQTAGHVDISLCQALLENFPKAKTPLDIYCKMPHYVRVYGALASKTTTLHTKCDTKWKPTTISNPSLAFVTLAALQTMAWTATKAVLKDMESQLPAQPRSQRDARLRPDWERWLRAEEVRMKTCFDKGTIYVDDGISATNDPKMYKEFLSALSKDIKLSNQPEGPISWYLGTNIKQDPADRRIKLSQAQYVKDILELFGMTGANLVSTPLELNTHLIRDYCPAPGQIRINKQFRREYQRIVGSLMYLASFTCPDLAHAVNQCSRFMANPDADHAGDPDTRQSVTGYVTMLNGAAVSWGSNRQQVVALSSSEAEFYAASAAGCDVSYFCMLLDHIRLTQCDPTVVFKDNWACIHLSRNLVLHHKTKHIDVRVYHLRNLCRLGVMNLLKVSTTDMVADALTKALPRQEFTAHSSVMMNLKLVTKLTGTDLKHALWNYLSDQ
eukprot:3942007-Rhodomonas_salina.2